MTILVADAAVYLRANDFIDAVPENGRRTWPVLGRRVWVGHRELMVLLYCAGVFELHRRGLVELVDYDGEIGVRLVQDLDAPLDRDAEQLAQPFSCARDFRSGIGRVPRSGGVPSVMLGVFRPRVRPDGVQCRAVG
jgi:hypothetical protein